MKHHKGRIIRKVVVVVGGGGGLGKYETKFMQASQDVGKKLLQAETEEKKNCRRNLNL